MKTEIYAEALIAMTEGGASPKEAVATLARYTDVRGIQGIMKRLPAILHRHALAHAREREVVLSVARERDAAHAKSEITELGKDLGADIHAVRVAVDDSLIGGWRLTTRNMLVDNSFKKQLSTIYSRITR